MKYTVSLFTCVFLFFHISNSHINYSSHFYVYIYSSREFIGFSYLLYVRVVLNYISTIEIIVALPAEEMTDVMHPL